jgi:hypothetical protein
MAKRGEINDSLGQYAIGMEAGLVAFAVGGAFVSFQYIEMLWHYFGLTMALEHIAVTQAAERRRMNDQSTPISTLPTTKPAEEPEFAWG